MRFDEIELQPVTFDVDSDAAPPSPPARASIFRRLAALLIDLSLFAALGLALSPLLPASMSAISIASLAGFLVIVAIYYFAGTRALWGRTIGGAIFDVRVQPRRGTALR
ncbi:MAG TPA: RDD family protein [Thermoanaerobaculia bacterium]|nr:RDD family protein [Thermoanaerobaculia bacterium]